MISLKQCILLVVLSTLFTGIIFVVERVFFPRELQEEMHLEPSFSQESFNIATPEEEPHRWYDDSEIPQEEITWPSPEEQEQAREKLLQSYLQKARERKQQQNIVFSYIPSVFRSQVKTYEEQSRDFLSSDSFEHRIEKIKVELYQKMFDTRGKMKNKTIKMYGVTDLPPAEYLSVFAHEFAHYVDIYSFDAGAFGDESEDFYDISWESTSIVKPGQIQSNFVSGYAMTNKYEDFAESFTYYTLHNDDFWKKSQGNSILKQKYDFFAQTLYSQWEFIDTDFSQDNVIRSYYWDITKLPVNVKNFLQYIENSI